MFLCEHQKSITPHLILNTKLDFICNLPLESDIPSVSKL